MLLAPRRASSIVGTFCSVSIGPRLAGIDIGQGLARRVFHDIAARYAFRAVQGGLKREASTILAWYPTTQPYQFHSEWRGPTFVAYLVTRLTVGGRRPLLRLTSAALALFTGELLVGAAFGAIHEEAPENGGLGASPVPYGGNRDGEGKPITTST